MDRQDGGWRAWVALICRRALYRQMSISLASVDWYDRLSLAMRQDGWQMARIDGHPANWNDHASACSSLPHLTAQY